ncbi:MAG: hypothetical protein ICV60_09550 [Pyrinomonadaceae bacterium]|nr:hypothetical protein [Pyrinomonadaceae bacterium]
MSSFDEIERPSEPVNIRDINVPTDIKRPGVIIPDKDIWIIPDKRDKVELDLPGGGTQNVPSRPPSQVPPGGDDE